MIPLLLPRNLTTGWLVAGLLAAILLGASLNGVQARQDSPQPAAPQAALGTAFTYQGQLKDGSALANGSYDFQFTLYDLLQYGSPVAGTFTLTVAAVPVTDGEFTVQLDFGNFFNGSKVFLEIAVRRAGGGSYTTLFPRQELTPAPFARYASVAPWEGLTGKPAALRLRKVYVPGAALSHANSANFGSTTWGLLVKNSTQPATFITPAPADWDPTTPFTVTLYFALPTSTVDAVANWRLQAGGALMNLGAADASTGWDSLSYGDYEDGVPLNVFAAGGHFNLTKSQSWTAKWSTLYGTWYFGDTNNTANDFSDNPIWIFGFSRGAASGNGETYTGDMVVVAAELTYLALP